MAVQFLTGINSSWNIDLNNNELQQVVIDNAASDPSGIAGKIYYNTADNKLRLYNGTIWADFQTGADQIVTYDLSGVGSTNGTAGVRLTGSDSTTDDVLIVGSGHITVTRSGNTLTVNGEDTTVGTVTNVLSGVGIVITGTSTVTPTVNVDYTGTGVINDAGTLSGPVASDDLIIIGDTSASGAVKKATVDQIPLSALSAATANISLGNNKITNLANGTATSDAINLGQLNTAVAGLGVFRGAYDAATNNPNLDTTSNVAANQGDFWVVNVDGDFFTQAVEVGDFIFANADIPANDATNALSKWTVVAADSNVAGVGSTSANTEIGVAGFNSATFSAAANGWISVKPGGISNAQLANTYNQIIGIDTDINTSGVQVVDQISLTDGVVQVLTTRTLPNSTTTSVGVTQIATQAEVTTGTDAFRYVTPATLAGEIVRTNIGYSDDLPSANATTWDIVAATHGLGTGPFIVQTYEVSSGSQVFMDIDINSTNGTVTFTTQATSTASSYRCNLLKVVNV